MPNKEKTQPEMMEREGVSRSGVETKLRLLRNEIAMLGSLTVGLGGLETAVLGRWEQSYPGHLRQVATNLPEEAWQALKQLITNPSNFDISSLSPETMEHFIHGCIAVGTAAFAGAAISRLKRYIELRKKTQVE